MIRRLLVAGCALSALGVATFLLQVLAPPGADPSAGPLDVTVTNARPLQCRDGAALWSVGATVRIQGTPGSSVERAALTARYATASTSRWRHLDVTVRAPNGFVTGARVNPDGVLRTTPDVHVTLPCDARSARLVAAIRLVGNEQVERDDSPFLSQGVAMSLSSVGGIGAVALLAFLLFSTRALTRTAK